MRAHSDVTETGNAERTIGSGDCTTDVQASVGQSPLPITGFRNRLALVSHCQLEIFPHRMPLETRSVSGICDPLRRRQLRLVQPQQIEILSQNNSTGVGFRFASSNIHHGGFTGAVRTDHAPEFALEHKYGTDRVDNPQDTSTSASLASHR